jgi:transposase, IS5 family
MVSSYAPMAVNLHGCTYRHAHRQAAERRPAFRRAVKWRTGSEGRISTLKRGYGWDRTRLDAIQGARTWTGYRVLAHNLVKISTLAA